VTKIKPNTAQMAPFNIARRDADALKALSVRTRVTQAAYLREAVADLLKKYREVRS
jgi:predicted DNA-binding protein